MSPLPREAPARRLAVGVRAARRHSRAIVPPNNGPSTLPLRPPCETLERGGEGDVHPHPRPTRPHRPSAGFCPSPGAAGCFTPPFPVESLGGRPPEWTQGPPPGWHAERVPAGPLPDGAVSACSRAWPSRLSACCSSSYGTSHPSRPATTSSTPHRTATTGATPCSLATAMSPSSSLARGSHHRRTGRLRRRWYVAAVLTDTGQLVLHDPDFRQLTRGRDDGIRSPRPPSSSARSGVRAPWICPVLRAFRPSVGVVPLSSRFG